MSRTDETNGGPLGAPRNSSTWIARLNPDHVVALLALATYVALVLELLPSTAWLWMIGCAIVLALALLIIARVQRGKPMAGLSIFVVSFAGAGLLVMPNLPAMGGKDVAAVPLGFFGSQAVALLWATLRRGADAPLPPLPLRTAIRPAMFGAGFLSAIATVPLGIAVISDYHRYRVGLLVYPAYFVGATGVAITFWLLRPVAHRPVGLYLIGVLGGFCMYGAVAPVVAVVEPQGVSAHTMLIVSAICGFFVGPSVAFALISARTPTD